MLQSQTSALILRPIEFSTYRLRSLISLSQVIDQGVQSFLSELLNLDVDELVAFLYILKFLVEAIHGELNHTDGFAY